MKLLQILPELEEGGVERHVLALSQGLIKLGHQVTVVSAGGRLETALAHGVIHKRLPVHSKNPLTILACAWRLSVLIHKQNFELIHAHSRVPAWIGFFASHFSQIPLVVTAHFLAGNKSHWIYKPYRAAAKVICVTSAVEKAMSKCFSGNTVVIHNGLEPPALVWNGQKSCKTKKLLFIGRLTAAKGLQDVLKALSKLKGNADWQLDILGDGPMRDNLMSLASEEGLKDKVFFHGFRNDTDDWLANCSCLLFPSHHEGMGLTFARAIQMKTPVIASNIPAVREFCLSSDNLPEPGDQNAWHKAIANFLLHDTVPGLFNSSIVPSSKTMTLATEIVYNQSIEKQKTEINK